MKRQRRKLTKRELAAATSKRDHDFSDRNAAIAWIANHQIARRNLESYQRGVLVLKEKEALEAAAKERQGRPGHARDGGYVPPKSAEHSPHPKGEAIDQLAKKAGVGKTKMRQIGVIEEKGDEGTKAKVASGETSVNKAYQNIVGKSDPDSAPRGGGAFSWIPNIDKVVEKEELTVVRIKKTFASHEVEWSDGDANKVDRNALLQRGYKKRQHRKPTKRELAAITSKRGVAVRRIAAKPPPDKPTAAACSAAGRRIGPRPSSF